MHRMLRRIGFYLVALWASVTINFFIPRLAPGNPAQVLNDVLKEVIDQGNRFKAHPFNAGFFNQLGDSLSKGLAWLVSDHFKPNRAGFCPGPIRIQEISD